MAYINQEKKKKITTAIKALNLPSEWKMTFGIRNNMTFVCKIRQAPASVITDCIIDNADMRKQVAEGSYSINQYHFTKHFKGQTLKVIAALMETINAAGENYDKSDPMTDYFNVGFYVDLEFGDYNKPCVFVKKAASKKIKAKVAAAPKAVKNYTRITTTRHGTPIPSLYEATRALLERLQDIRGLDLEDYAVEELRSVEDALMAEEAK